jgi:hypothetical protein
MGRVSAKAFPLIVLVLVLALVIELRPWLIQMRVARGEQT